MWFDSIPSLLYLYKTHTMTRNRIIRIAIILLLNLLLCTSCATSGMASTCWGKSKVNKNGIIK